MTRKVLGRGLDALISGDTAAMATEGLPAQAGTTELDGWIEVVRGLSVSDLLIAGDAAGLKDGERIEITGEAGAGGHAHGAD